MNHEFDRDPLADALRASLQRHADEAPMSDLLAERIIHAADRASAGPQPHSGKRSGWRTFGLPLVAAGAVAAVVGAVVGIESYHSAPSHAPAVAGASRTVTHRPQPGPAPAPKISAFDRATVPSSEPKVSVSGTGADLTNIKLYDLTFASSKEGWALASADCTTGAAGRCTALLHTTDGSHWVSVSPTPFNVADTTGGCSYPCVNQLRFLDDSIGYAFGPSAFLVTENGGKTWSREAGGALFLEGQGGNVIRVFAKSDSGCPGPCDVQVETASNNAPAEWKSASLPQGPIPNSDSLSFARSKDDAYLLVKQNPNGGASDETSTLYRSTDRGQTWSSDTEPCPQGGGEVDSTAVAAGTGGEVSLLCQTRTQPGRAFVATSDDAGVKFPPQGGTIPASAAIQGLLAVGDTKSVQLVGASTLALTTDGGTTWQNVPTVTGTVDFIGFESDTVARVVTDSRIIWTTTDGGQNWSEVVLP